MRNALPDERPIDEHPADELITDVLVVGAGPTGLMIANWLARLGVSVTVIDGKAGPTKKSRALVVQARSMEIYDQLGVVDEVLAQAVAVRSIAPGFGRRVFRLVSTTDRVFAAVTSERWIASVVRRGVIPLVGPIAVRLVPRIQGASRIFEYVSQVRIHYWMNARERAGGRRGVTVGRRLPWSGDNFAVLRSATWQVHVYGSVDPNTVARLGTTLGVPVHCFRAPSTPRLSAGMFYLVRPDGFVAAQASASAAPAEFNAALPDRYLVAAGG